MPNSAVTVVSFYTGQAYYRNAAAQLIEDCNRLGLPHDIVAIETQDGQDWADICRMKVAFYRQMFEKHPAGILWIDVDTRIRHLPDCIARGGHDFAACLRGTQDLRDFDAAIHTRTFQPYVLHFNATAPTKAFLDHMVALDQATTAKVTDDYLLEEAWRSFEGYLTVTLLARDLVAQGEADLSAKTCLVLGRSGHVRSFVNRVEQHAPALRMPTRERALLHQYASEAMRAGRLGEASVFLNKAVELGPDDATAAALAKVRARRWRPKRLYGAILRVVRQTPKASPDGRPAAEAALAAGDLGTTRRLLDRIAAAGDARDAGFLASRRFRLDLEERAARMPAAAEPRPALWWMESPFPGNFGDILNPYVVEKLSGVPPKFVDRGEGILAIGSVIKFARPGTAVWGTGTPRMTDALSPFANYRAVRGPLTRELVLRSGGVVPEIYGDPALLLPLIYRPDVPKTHKLGLIRHFTHADAPLAIDGVHEIDVRRIGYDGIEAFIREVLACEAILSTSLHGLIVAQAYGIPTRWCTVTGTAKSISGDGTKFFDHYATLGIKAEEPLDLAAEKAVDVSLLDACTERATRRFDAAALLQVAPFAVQPHYIERALREADA